MFATSILDDQEIKDSISFRPGHNSNIYLITNDSQLDLLVKKRVIEEKFKEQILQDPNIEKMDYIIAGIKVFHPYLLLVASGGTFTYGAASEKGVEEEAI